MTTDESVESAAADGERASAAVAGDRARMLSAAVLALVLTALWIWWPLEQGAYFPVVYLPGAILLYVTLITLLIVAPPPISFRGPHAVALAALLAFTGWTALSLLWSPAQDLALEDAQRTMIYPVAFLAGLWLSALLRNRPVQALAPWVVAAVTVATVTLVRVLGADAADDVFDAEDQTLALPFAYRNASAAFFVVSALILVSVVARRRTAVPLQAALSGVTVVCVCLAVLAQSRGSVLAVAAGTLALLLASRERLRIAITLILVAIPTVLLLPELLDPFAAAERRLGLEELQEAVRLVPFAALGGAVLALPVGLLLNRFQRPADASPRRAGRLRVVVVVGAILVTIAVALSQAGDPMDWVSNKASQAPDSRFTYSGGKRPDFWAVAWDQFSESPVIGEGSGSFRTRYARDRDSRELPRDAHGLPLETLGELGLIGAILVLVAGSSVAVGLARSRRLGSDQATLAAAGIAVGAAWTAQASVDWLTSMPGLTASVLALTGAGVGLAAAEAGGRPGRAVRASAVGLLALVILAAAPQYASERLAFSAAEHWRADPDGAFDALDRAADLNPFADQPLLVKAEIAKQIGDTVSGLAALDRARDRQPREWLNYLLRAEILVRADPPAARSALTTAEGLNPRERDLARLRKELGAPRASSEPQSP